MHNYYNFCKVFAFTVWFSQVIGNAPFYSPIEVSKLNQKIGYIEVLYKGQWYYISSPYIYKEVE